jgi:hypothetical protein
VAETVRGPIDPRKSPSYPQRVHIRERPQLQQLLKTWEERIASAGLALASSTGQSPERQRLYSQMLGARDQLADAAKRLPTEVGAIYEEDRLRLDEAIGALERLFQKWEKA